MKKSMRKIITRKNIRLKEYDYSKQGYYFITICTKNRENILSKIQQQQCRGEHCSSISTVTKEGAIVEKYLKKIEEIYNNIAVDEYIIMPNHIHMIFIINNKALNSVSKIIQQFKGAVTKELKYSIWQKLFYEHIMRNEKEYIKIKEYIINNPDNWKEDMYY